MKGVTSQGRLNYTLASMNREADAFPILFSFSFSLCLHIDSKQAKSKPASLHPVRKVGPPFPSIQCSVTHSLPPNWLLFSVCKGTLYDDHKQESRDKSTDPVTLHLILVCMLNCVQLSMTL